MEGNVIDEKSLDSFLDEARGKGMHVVDNTKLTEAYKDYEQQVRQADELSEVVDPEETPYLSKYKARDMLDMLCSKLEANRTIASMEKNAEIVYETNWRIAALRVRLGTLAWEVEEPHNTQVELELAAEFYCPGFISTINDMSGEVGTEAAKDVSVGMEPPAIVCKYQELCADVMKCMNMLGILWAGRDHVKRSFLYLLASKQYYDNTINEDITPKNREDMEETLTLNLFYLAQAYGFVGDVSLSAHYCHMTLQRQLKKGFKDIKDAVSWCSNCMGMADFYIALADFNSAAHALLVTGKILEVEIRPRTGDLNESNKEKVLEIEADINRRWIRLDSSALKRAVETIGESSFEESNNSQSARFSDLELPETPLLGRADIQSFESAREVFLRCSSKLEIAKKAFPMEGFVTDHINLVREHANIYHYLASFEKDTKRKLAMELRRSELLRSFLLVSKTSYEVFHKEMSYELGETYMTMYELKLEKIAEKNPTVFQNAEKAMKLADIKKCNEYCTLTMAMFSHFISMYTSCSEHLGENPKFIEMSADDLIKIPLRFPKVSDAINPDEVRPFLNAHFFIARMLTKLLPLPDTLPNERAKYTIAGLKVYEWISKNADEICAMKDVSVGDIFKQEMEICQDMIGLLPQKIGRMHYLGEGGMI